MAYICSPIRGNGVWRSWLAHLVWDQRVLCSSHSTPTKEIKVFDFGLFFMSAHLRAGAVSRTEDASGAAGDCPQSMESAVLRAFEDASRTREGCFWHRISLPYRKRLFFTPNASENASRTPGSLFEHGTHIPYPSRPSPVPNANRGILVGLIV